MNTMRTGSENLIFWGSGATASIGLRTTVNQAKAIKTLVKDASTVSLQVRVTAGLARSSDCAKPVSDLLLVLGDDTEDIYRISHDAREAMGRHWQDQSRDELDARILELRALFDWPALKEAVRICPGFTTEDGFQLQDIFNILDLHSTHGFPAEDNSFLSPSRLIAARRALQLILNTLFYVDWQTVLVEKPDELEKHMGFARLLTQHHQQVGLDKAASLRYFDNRDFYLGDIAFASLNYDPVALWAQFIANRDANKNPPYIGIPRSQLKIFHDFGIFMAVSIIESRIEGDPEPKERVWYPLNEASAQRLNDRDHFSRRVRINKFLFPHGCLCWRECPSCGKLSAYMGKKWEFASRQLIPPPPLRGFIELAQSKIQAETDTEKDAWDQGKVDARSCVHCGELTFAQHTQAVMQSNFKASPPSFIEEVQRDLRVATQAAKHIILMGYSLPPDDVAYRAFFAARRRRNDKNGNSLRCSVVVGTEWGNQWHYPGEIDGLLDNMNVDEAPRTTLETARDLFGKENVRFFGGGIPEVFCDGNDASEQRFKELINWEKP